MTTSTKPTILLIPGSFSPAHLYNDTIATITATGYEVQAYDLPSTSTTLDKPAASLYDDADFFRSKAQAILDSGKDVVLLSHSYGGMVASEALKGLPTITKSDKKPVIKGWVAVSSLLLPVGVSLNVGTGGEKPDFVNIEGNYQSLLPEGCAQASFSDLPLADGIAAAKKMTMQSLSSFASELTHPGYWDVPLAYVKTTQDKLIPLEAQEGMVEMVRTGRQGIEVKVWEIESGHCPNASRPEELGRMAVEAVQSFA